MIYQSTSDIRKHELELDESLSLYKIVLLSDHVEDLNASKISAKANWVNVGKEIKAEDLFLPSHHYNIVLVLKATLLTHLHVVGGNTTDNLSMKAHSVGMLVGAEYQEKICRKQPLNSCFKGELINFELGYFITLIYLHRR